MSPKNSSGYKLTYKDTTFLGLLKIVGIKVFKNWSFFWAILFTGLLTLFINLIGDFTKDFIKISQELSPILLSTSGGVFGIVIAALSVTIALFHQSLLPMMLEKKLIHKYLFPFWKAVLLWATSIMICILLIVFNSVKYYYPVPFVVILEIFIFTYASFYTVRLTGLVIQLALQRSQIGE